MNTRSSIPFLALAAALVALPAGSPVQADPPKPAAPAKAAPPPPPPPPKVVTKASFRVLGEAGRDPFMPVGTRKPAPRKGGEGPAPVERPKVTVKLRLLNVIWLPPDNVSAMVEGVPGKVREGKDYDYADPVTKTTIKYKVKRVTEDAIQIEYEEEPGVLKTDQFIREGSDINKWGKDPDDVTTKPALDQLYKEKE